MLNSSQRHLIFLLISLLFLVGCTSTTQIKCKPNDEYAISELLYFGTAKAKGIVTPKEWADFLRSSVTPRFPKGFTIWQANGQWQDKNGAIVSEESYVLNILHPDDTVSELSVHNIAAEYKLRFRQEAVLRVKQNACISYNLTRLH
jgi:hypothetical protein